MNGLHRHTNGAMDRSSAAICFKNFVNDGLHERLNIRLSDITQAPIYLKRGKDAFASICDSRAMQTLAFDLDAVKAAMKSRGVTQSALAEAVGLTSQSAISNLLKGKRQVKAHEALKLYEFLGIKGDPDFRVAPIIGIAAAGNWREAINLPIGQMPYPSWVASDRAFGIEVSGDSMNLLVQDGGWVLIDPARKELCDNCCYLIQNGDGGATIKRYKTKPGRFVPVSTNPEHQEFLAAETDFIVLGRVVWKGERV
jgi:SOS-response transcriptional repressor LexA